MAPKISHWLGILLAIAASASHAESSWQVTAYHFDDVEIRRDGEYTTIHKTALAQPPFSSNQRDEFGFLLIKDAQGNAVWANEGDLSVIWSALEGINCQNPMVATEIDDKNHSTRGAGSSCKN